MTDSTPDGDALAWARTLSTMPRTALAALYRQWSEERYAAQWMHAAEDEFARWILGQPQWAESPDPPDHEIAGVAKMRAIFEEAARGASVDEMRRLREALARATAVIDESRFHVVDQSVYDAVIAEGREALGASPLIEPQEAE